MKSRREVGLLCVVMVVVVLVLCLGVDEVKSQYSSTVTLNFWYPVGNLPKGATLTLRGSGLGLSWTSGVPMKYVATNQWQYSITYDNNYYGEILEVKPLVNDNVWSIGNNFQISLPASESTSVDLYPWFYTNTGQYTVLPEEIYSPQLNNNRSLVIYTPPSYYENTLKQMNNVLVMHDGQNLFNASTSFIGIAWDCQDTIDTLVNEGRMDEVFILGVYNTINRTYEYTYDYDPDCECPGGAGGGGDLYLDFLYDTVIPYVATQYRIQTNRENLGILGSSLGGLISCYAGWTRPDEYSKAGCMSSSFWWNNQDFNNGIMVNYTVPADEIFYLDSGNAGPGQDDVQQTINVRNHMEMLGFQLNNTLFYYLDKGGQHNEYYWGHRFWVPMTELYPVPVLIPS